MREMARSKYVQLVLPFMAGAVMATNSGLAASLVGLALLAVAFAASTMTSVSVPPVPSQRQLSSRTSNRAPRR